MRLKNILLVADDVERSRRFYQELFGLKTVRDFGGNVILTDGLVLQDRAGWEQLIGKSSKAGDADAELYFEENDLDAFLGRLRDYPEPIRCLNPLREYAGGKRVIRIYDPDGHVIEVSEQTAGREEADE